MINSDFSNKSFIIIIIVKTYFVGPVGHTVYLFYSFRNLRIELQLLQFSPNGKNKLSLIFYIQN